MTLNDILSTASDTAIDASLSSRQSHIITYCPYPPAWPSLPPASSLGWRPPRSGLPQYRDCRRSAKPLLPYFSSKHLKPTPGSVYLSLRSMTGFTYQKNGTIQSAHWGEKIQSSSLKLSFLGLCHHSIQTIML